MAVVCQVATGLVFAAVVVLVIFPLRIWRWVVLSYATAPGLGVVLLLASTCLSPATVWQGIRGDPLAVEPFSILLLLYGLAYGCISIDVSGVLAWFAAQLAARAKTPQRLFAVVFGLSSAFTVLTSNDVVILTLTPIVCDVCAAGRRDPAPFLVAMFFAANIWSALLIVGNPTNVIVGTSYQLSFAVYSAWAAVPSVAAGLGAMAMLLFYFRKDWWPRTESSADGMSTDSETMQTAEEMSVAEDAANPREAGRVVVHRASAAFGLASLAVTLILMFALSFVRVPLWILGLAFGCAMLAKDAVVDLVRRPLPAADSGVGWFARIKTRLPTVATCVGRLPPDLVPFMLGMFVLVEALKQQGLLQHAADGLTATLALTGFSYFATVFVVGTLSTLLCSVLNNQPMAILVSSVVQLSHLPPSAKRAAMLSAALGSNFGANLSFVASLAGLMFVAILKPFGVSVSQSYFCRAGFAVMPPVLCVAFAALSVEAWIVQ